MLHARAPRFAIAAAFCFWLGAGSGTSLAQGGTTLKITNGSAAAVPVQVALGAGNGISTLDQLPSSWGPLYPDPSAPTQQGIFFLAAGSSVEFNSGSQTFSGNIAFGPTFTSRGCGSSASLPNPCYPDASSLAEFSLNMGSGNAEAVDISGVNGTNALLTLNFSGQGTNNQWNDGSFSGANPNVTQISNQPITTWTSPVGVYGWQATNCVNIVDPIPNPTANCPAPVEASAAQLQANAQCNIQRNVGAPTGGTVEVVFNGYASSTSAPQPGCSGAYVVSPTSGSQNGGTTVTLTGWGLDQVMQVTFQGAAATIQSQASTSLVLVTPACNFCGGPQPWYSNVELTLSSSGSITLPNTVAGPAAPAAWTYTP